MFFIVVSSLQMVVCFVACYSCELIGPRLGGEPIVTPLFSFSIFATAPRPYSGRKCNDEKVKPSEHTGLGSVSLFVSQYLLVAPMVGAEEDILTERDTTALDIELVMIAVALCSCEKKQSQAEKVLR
jgi:hypothetical protein